MVVDYGGYCVFHDVTVVNFFTAARIGFARNAEVSAYAVEVGLNGKVLKHFDSVLLAEPYAVFCPLVDKALVIADARFARPISDLARSVAAATGVATGHARRELLWRLSVALCHGNFRLLSEGRVYH